MGGKVSVHRIAGLCFWFAAIAVLVLGLSVQDWGADAADEPAGKACGCGVQDKTWGTPLAAYGLAGALVAMACVAPGRGTLARWAFALCCLAAAISYIGSVSLRLFLWEASTTRDTVRKLSLSIRLIEVSMQILWASAVIQPLGKCVGCFKRGVAPLAGGLAVLVVASLVAVLVLGSSSDWIVVAVLQYLGILVVVVDGFLVRAWARSLGVLATFILCMALEEFSSALGPFVTSPDFNSYSLAKACWLLHYAAVFELFCALATCPLSTADSTNEGAEEPVAVDGSSAAATSAAAAADDAADGGFESATPEQV